MSQRSELLRLLDAIDPVQFKRVIVSAIEVLLPTPEALKQRRVTEPRARIAAFLFDRCEVLPGAECSVATLCDAYASWAASKGFHPVTASILSKQLIATDSTIGLAVRNGRRRYTGVRPKSKRDTLSH